MVDNKCSIGIDIGTSNIVVVLVDEKKNLIDAMSQKNMSVIKGKDFESLQNPDKILEIIHEILEQILGRNKEKKILGIGVSNQMHGIVYVDKNGGAISPLYNWQDKRGNEKFYDCTYSSYIQDNTGYNVPTGYGLATHFYNLRNDNIPKEAMKILDIGTFIVGQLTNQSIFFIHPTNAHALGFYNFECSNFDEKALEILGVSLDILPEVKESKLPLGSYKNIPVFNALGDNQLGFFGLPGNKKDIVSINIGTSAQLSFLCNADIPELEKRPFLNGETLWVASSLCGGKGVDLWVSFLVDVITLFTDNRDKKQLKQKVFAKISDINVLESSLEFFPFFYGTRNNASTLASIDQLSAENFNFEDISIALLTGIIDELYRFWKCVPEINQKEKKILYITGGATKLDVVYDMLKKIFCDLEIKKGQNGEDAAVGAAQIVWG